LGHPVLARCANILGTQLAREDGIKHSGCDVHVNECSRFEDRSIPLGGTLKLQIGQQGGMWSSYVDSIDITSTVTAFPSSSTIGASLSALLFNCLIPSLCLLNSSNRRRVKDHWRDDYVDDVDDDGGGGGDDNEESESVFWSLGM
jgi:hypothetical protein